MTMRAMGAISSNAWVRTFTAETAGLTKGYGVIQGSNVGGCKAPTAANQKPVGLLVESTVNVGDAAAVIEVGEGIAIAGAAIGGGQFVKLGSDGRWNPITAPNDAISGYALSPAAQAGDEFVMVVLPQHPAPMTEVDNADGAIALTGGTVVITKGSACALTLAAPVAGADDGKTLVVVSTTGFAHTVTTPANKINGTLHIATFNTTVGTTLSLRAYGGVWYASAVTGITLS